MGRCATGVEEKEIMRFVARGVLKVIQETSLK